VLGATHLEKFSLPVFVGVLKESKKDPPCDPRKTYPKALPLLLYLEKMQEDVHGGEDS